MNTEDKIFSILNEIQSQMNSMESKIGSMESKIGSMESKMGSMETKMGSMETEMVSMKSQIDSIEFETKNLKSDIKDLGENQISMGSIIDSNHKELLARFDRLEDKFIELEGVNASNHVITNTRLDKIAEELEFLAHKEFQNEKAVYKINKKLELIK